MVSLFYAPFCLTVGKQEKEEGNEQEDDIVVLKAQMRKLNMYLKEKKN